MSNISISVLILTHNRPKLFLRCIESVINAYENFNIDLEILVNNDSNDIIEIYNSKISVSYTYDKNKNLGILYKNLFVNATNEYIYFLEDDDIMNIDFFKIINNYKSDIIYGRYVPYLWNKNFIRFFSQKSNENKESFLESYDDKHFQFSQICFRKKALNLDQFPTDNNIHNDYLIFKKLKGSFRVIPDILYKQTTDGNDNISFKRLNKDIRWNLQKN